MEIAKHLIRICKEREAGYEAASNKVDDAVVKNTLSHLAFQSKTFIEILSPFLRLHTPSDSEEHKLSELFKDWMDFESSVSGNDIPAVIQSCKAGEEKAIDSYEEALENESLNSLRKIIQDQLLEMKDALEILSDLKQQVL